MNQIKRFMDQNLSWLIVNQKQFQFWKSKILFSYYVPLYREPFFLTHLVKCFETHRILKQTVKLF